MPAPIPSVSASFLVLAIKIHLVPVARVYASPKISLASHGSNAEKVLALFCVVQLSFWDCFPSSSEIERDNDDHDRDSYRYAAQYDPD